MQIEYICDIYSNHFNLKVRHAAMSDNITSTISPTSTTSNSSFISTLSTTSTDNGVTNTTTITTTIPTDIPTTKPDVWDQYGVIIISVVSAVIVLLLIFIISMTVFMKWRSKRRTEGAYNPSRAEKLENEIVKKNKIVFSIPLPTPERLI